MIKHFLTSNALRTLASVASVIALIVGTNTALAMELTPTEPTNEPPSVVDSQATLPTATDIIVKYVGQRATLNKSLESSQNMVSNLSKISGADLQHVRFMSGNSQVVRVRGLTGMKSMEVTETIQSVANRIAEDPAVEYAEPDAFMGIQQSVNDPRFSDQWHYTRPNTGINLPSGWAIATGSGVNVAVIDTGYRPHVDLQANLLPGYDFITNTTLANDGGGRDSDARDPGDWCPPTRPNSSWHGTHVAGTVAALTNNGIGVAGIAHNAKVVPVRVLGKCGGNLSDIADGMRWAAGLSVSGVPNNPNPAKVLNLSLGGSGACGPTYQNAINAIVGAGTVVVVAAGNSNMDAANFRPANCIGVITVASTNQDGARAFYSNRGSAVELSAPGGETFSVTSRGVLSTLNTGTTTPGADSYAFYQGTSMAAPHVAGIVALLFQLDPSLTPAQVLTKLQTTAQPFPIVTPPANQCDTQKCGSGIVDAGKAVNSIEPDVNQASMPWVKLLLHN